MDSDNKLDKIKDDITDIKVSLSKMMEFSKKQGQELDDLIGQCEY